MKGGVVCAVRVDANGKSDPTTWSHFSPNMLIQPHMHKSISSNTSLLSTSAVAVVSQVLVHVTVNKTDLAPILLMLSLRNAILGPEMP